MDWCATILNETHASVLLVCIEYMNSGVLYFISRWESVHALMTVHPTIGKFIEINTQACMQGLLNISFKQKILTEKQCQTVEELSKVKIEH